MSIKWPIVVGTLAASLFLASSMAQLLTNKGPPSSAYLASNLRLPYVQHGKVQMLPPIPSPGIEASYQTAQRPEAVKNHLPVRPEPGVYRTTPFACIVIVPGNDLDASMAIRPPETACPMPLLKPELNFIPLQSK